MIKWRLIIEDLVFISKISAPAYLPVILGYFSLKVVSLPDIIYAVTLLILAVLYGSIVLSGNFELAVIVSFYGMGIAIIGLIEPSIAIYWILGVASLLVIGAVLIFSIFMVTLISTAIKKIYHN